MRIKTTTLVMLGLITFKASAGQDRGGGNVVVCKKGSEISSIELLDYYEGRIRRDFEIDLGNPNAPVFEIVNIALDRLAKYMPEKASEYRTSAENFLSNTRFYKNVRLSGIEDSRHLFLPTNCALEQAAVQIDPEFSEDRIYNINQDIWDQLDNLNKAGLILHEIIYSDVRAKGAENSSVARRFNALIASRQMENIGLRELYESLKDQIRSPIYFRGIPFLNLNFYESGSVSSGNAAKEDLSIQIAGEPAVYIRLKSGSTHFYEDGSVSRASVWYNSRHTLRTSNGMADFVCPDAYVDFHESGLYKGACNLRDDRSFTVLGSELKFSKGRRINFHASGIPEFGTLVQAAKVTAGNVILEVPGNKGISLHSNGKLKAGVISKNYLLNAGGQKVGFLRDTVVQFFENGNFERGTLLNDTSLKLESGSIVLKRNTNALFSESGKLYAGNLASSTTLKVGNDLITFKKDSDIYFHGNGNVKRGEIQHYYQDFRFGTILEWDENGTLLTKL